MIQNMFRLSIILPYIMISLMTWNARGSISSTMCLSAFLDKEKCDIVITTEHKLKGSTKNYLEIFIMTMSILLNLINSVNAV